LFLFAIQLQHGYRNFTIEKRKRPTIALRVRLCTSKGGRSASNASPIPSNRRAVSHQGSDGKHYVQINIRLNVATASTGRACPMLAVTRNECADPASLAHKQREQFNCFGRCAEDNGYMLAHHASPNRVYRSVGEFLYESRKQKIGEVAPKHSAWLLIEPINTSIPHLASGSATICREDVKGTAYAHNNGTPIRPSYELQSSLRGVKPRNRQSHQNGIDSTTRDSLSGPNIIVPSSDPKIWMVRRRLDIHFSARRRRSHLKKRA